MKEQAMQNSNPGGRVASLVGVMTPDEDEQAERIADDLDAAHALHIAAGNPPRVLDPGMAKTGRIVPDVPDRP